MESEHPVPFREQMVYSVIPFLNLWAAYRIRRLRIFVLLLIVITIINFAVGFVIPFPYSLPVQIAIYIALVYLYMKRWTLNWNNKFSSSPEVA
jgi:hypothetical protein